MTRIIASLSEISASYEALFVDLWGCVHDGLRAHPAAVAALRAFRAQGGRVVLVTNSPRPADRVAAQIARMGVPDDCHDAIASSGDSAQVAAHMGAVGQKVWMISDGHDAGFLHPPAIVTDPVPLTEVGPDAAEGIICIGPDDPLAPPETYRPAFEAAIARGLRLLCANPDIVVDRGAEREWCAGALADLYTRLGGESLYFGKPHPPIYDLARRHLARLGDIADDRILCIGDGPETDLRGAQAEGLDALFISGGLAAVETGTTDQPDPARLDAWLARAGLEPAYAMGFLR